MIVAYARIIVLKRFVCELGRRADRLCWPAVFAFVTPPPPIRRSGVPPLLCRLPRWIREWQE